MKYKFPKICNTMAYRKTGENTIEAINCITGDEYTFSLAAARYVRRLDGYTHPYKIKTTLNKAEINDIISFLYKNELIKKSNVTKNLGTILRTFWEIKSSVPLHIIAFIWNKLLLISWLPVLIIGIYMFSKNYWYADFNMMWLGYPLGLIIGIILHEFGHAFAGLSYGARVFEMGVLVMYYVIPGAYVLMDSKTVKKRMQRVQIDAAGVETNILLTGLFLICGAVNTSLGIMFYIAALCNASLAAVNLVFINGLDGASIISELLGSDDIVPNAFSVAFNKIKRCKLRKQGASGYAALAACYIICVMQIALPMLLILNILEVVLCLI